MGRGGEREAYRLGIAHLADEQDVRVLAEGVAETRREVAYVAADLPLPVAALASKSPPARAGGIDSVCTGVGSVKPFRARLLCRRADKDISVKVFIRKL